MNSGKDDTIRLTATLWAERDWSGRMTATDRKAMETWLAADERHAIEFDLAAQLLSSDELTGALASAARDYAIRPTRVRTQRLWLQPFWVGVGAMAAAAATVFSVMTFISKPIAPAEPTQQLAAIAQFVTPAGQGSTEILADGSRVDLNGGTSLTASFTATGRPVELVSGDAAFQVASDHSRPFVVSTQHLSATALGTAFTVSRFDGHSTVRVTEHEVHIASKLLPDRSVVARPGDVVDVDAAGAITITHNVGMPTDWRGGWIETQAMTIADLAATMQRRTGRAISVAAAVQNLTVSGRFRIDEPEAVLRRLELLHGLRVTKTRDGFALAAASPS